MMNKVILIYPKTGLDVKHVSVWVPWSVLYIGTVLKNQGYNVKIIDQRIESNWKTILINELKKEPICVGISSMTGKQILHGIEIAKIVRENSSCPIVWGGIHPTMMPEQTLKNDYVDIVVNGEGDLTFLELVKALEANKPYKNIKGICSKQGEKIKINPQREFVDMNILPFPEFKLLNMEDYFLPYLKGHDKMVTIFTSRGCPHRCTFCFNSKFNFFKWRALTPEKTVEIMAYLNNNYNINGLHIYDDNFFVNLKRVEEISKLMIKEKLDIGWLAENRVDYIKKITDEQFKTLKKSGCKTMFFGVESGSSRILELIKKDITVQDILYANRKLKEQGIIARFGFMSGFPTETKEELYKTFDLIDKILEENPSAEIHNIGIYAPYPGTELYDLCKKHNYNPPKKLEDWARFSYSISDATWISKKQKDFIRRVYLISRFIDDNWVKEYTQKKLVINLGARLFTKIAKQRWKHRFFKFPIEVDLLSFVYEKELL